MGKPYIEENGAAYPINDGLQCGQTDYRSDFGEEPIKSIKTKVSAAPRGERAKFLPRVPVRK